MTKRRLYELAITTLKRDHRKQVELLKGNQLSLSRLLKDYNKLSEIEKVKQRNNLLEERERYLTRVEIKKSMIRDIENEINEIETLLIEL